MKLFYVYKLLLLMVILLGSCRQKERVYAKIEEQFKKSLSIVHGNSSIQTPIYIVIPRAGCSSCISTAENYMLKALEDRKKTPQQTFILTDYDSEKILRARFGELSGNRQIIKDPDNVFKSNPSLKSVYPTIFMFNSQAELVKVSEVSPQKDGLVEIYRFLNQHK